MCKIFAMSNMTQVKVTDKFINTVRDAVCRHADRDGFGYALNTMDGKLWGQKTVNPFTLDPLANKKPNITNSLPIVSAQESFGPVGAENNISFIAHGRMSTNQVSTANTHPFVNSEVALIHNGVVSDPNDAVKGRLQTNCDTEILLRLWEHGGIESIEDNAAGYYAITVLDKRGQLHIARDSRAMLYIAYSKTVDSFLIGTNIEIISDIAKVMNWEIETPESIQDNVYAVFRGNDLMDYWEINPIGYDYSIDKSKVAASLGQYEYLSGDYRAFKADNEAIVNETDLDTELVDDNSELNSDDAPIEDAIDYADVITLINKRRLA